MALISLSDWLDRFDDGEAQPSASAALDSIRFEAAEDDLPCPGVRNAKLGTGFRQRLDQALRRTFWRLRRHAPGSA
jgi:hypothetical protein